MKWGGVDLSKPGELAELKKSGGEDGENFHGGGKRGVY